MSELYNIRRETYLAKALPFIDKNIINVYLLSVSIMIFVVSCGSPKGNENQEIDERAISNIVATDTMSINTSSTIENEVIILPDAPQWLTKDNVSMLKEWNDKAKHELYTFEDFIKTIPSIVKSYTSDAPKGFRNIATPKEYTSLSEITTDSAVYYFAAVYNPTDWNLYFCHQRWQKLMNSIIMNEASPIKLLGEYDDPDCPPTIIKDSQQFYLTNNGTFFFSIDFQYGCGELGGDGEGGITSDNSVTNYRWFYDMDGQEILAITMEYYFRSEGKEKLLHESELESTIDISTTDYCGGYPVITEHVENSDLVTKFDTTYTHVYKYDIESKRYKLEE